MGVGGGHTLMSAVFGEQMGNIWELCALPLMEGATQLLQLEKQSSPGGELTTPESQEKK